MHVSVCISAPEEFVAESTIPWQSDRTQGGAREVQGEAQVAAFKAREVQGEAQGGPGGQDGITYGQDGIAWGQDGISYGQDGKTWGQDGIT